MLFRVNSGNPAVPMARVQPGATQRSPLPGDSTEQSLRFGKPSGNRNGSTTFKPSPLRPATVQDDSAVSSSTANAETSGTHQESNREQPAASPSKLQDDDRQQQEPGASASGQAESKLSATEASTSGQAWAHGGDRHSDAQVQAASAPGSSAAEATPEAQLGAVGPASSSHHILQQQQGAVATTTGSYSSSDANGAVNAHLSAAGIRRDHTHGAAQQGMQHLQEANNPMLADPGECGRDICLACVSDMVNMHEHCIFLVAHSDLVCTCVSERQSAVTGSSARE